MAKANDAATSEIAIWTDPVKLEEIKGLVAQNLTNTEFQMLVQIGKATGLNPFLREIYAVKYNSAPASIFIGKNGYLKIANSHPNYDGHETEYVKDEKGNVIGCKATVYHKKRSHPVTIEVFLKEYDTDRSVWKEKKLTMLRKVALVQALRESFPEAFQGTYDESEDWNKEKEAAIDVEPTPAPPAPPTAKPAPPPSKDQLKEIENLFRELRVSEESKLAYREILKTAAVAESVLTKLRGAFKEQLEEIKAEASAAPAEVNEEQVITLDDPDEVSEIQQLMLDVKTFIFPEPGKTPRVQLNERFAQYCGKGITSDNATLLHWRVVHKVLKDRIKAQEKEVEAPATIEDVKEIFGTE